MADTLSEAAAAVAKLQLDEPTGEWVSKSELKKRNQKRARKAAKAERPKQSNATTSNEVASNSAVTEAQVDPDAMFKQGFLAEVYEENPVKEVVTRFPPEPNGYLHLGHVKAMAVDFGFARFHRGKTNLRFDDTNPSKEEEVFVESILDTVKWLGFSPDRITYSSGNFQKLYHLAQYLIKKDKAYVCHCNETDIKLQRGGEKGKEGPRFRCAHAEQDAQTNLDKFRDMHDGKYEPQTAFLRMKQDLESGNPMMWDIAAYRVPKLEEGKTHARAPGWKIFPTYDFAHCLCDSIEGVTHSLCTTEFILSRESYNWLNKTLGVYEPMQREFGRLNLAGTVMSKRALKTLINEKVVRGWDDPRLHTVIALRRRGVPPEALLAFVAELGVSTAQTTIPISRFEKTVREHLETSVPRLMMVLDPLPVEITDVEEAMELDAPWMPNDPSWGSHTLRLTRRIYIERSDFREEDAEGYFRLTPGKTVGLLRAPHPIKVMSFAKDEKSGLVTSVQASFDRENKPRAYVHWVPEQSVKAEVRIHKALFRSDEPMKAERGFLNDITPDSEEVYPGARIEVGLKERWPETERLENPENARFQALRVGYFAVDTDTTRDKMVVNRIVSLKVDAGKV